MKLTRTQKDILARLLEGEHLHYQKYSNGNPVRVYWGNDFLGPNLKRTADSLSKRGLITLVHNGISNFEFKITAEGSKADASGCRQ